MGNTATKEDWMKFISVMIVFIIGMIIMMVYEIENLWTWTAYIIIWTWAEMKIAKNIHLKWWVWVIILLGLSLLDLLFIKMINHLR